MTSDDNAAGAQALFSEAVELARSSQRAEAIALLEQAVDLIDERRDVVLFARISGYLAKQLHVAGDNAAALNHLMRVLALVSSDGLRDRLRDRNAVFAVVQAHIFFVDFARDDASVHASKLLEVLDAAEAFLEETGFGSWRDGVLACRAGLFFDLGREQEAVSLQREAVEIGVDNEDAAPGLGLVSKQRSLVRMLRECERFEEAEDLARQLLADPKTCELNRLGTCNQLGHLLLETDGDVAEVITLAERGVELSQRFGRGTQSAILGLLFEALQKDGQYERCAEVARRHLQLAEQHGVTDHLCGAFEDMAAAHINLGELEEAEAYLQKAEALAQKLDSTTERTDYQDEVAEVRERFEAKKSERSSSR